MLQSLTNQPIVRSDPAVPVEAAWSVLLSRRENTEDLRRWAQRIALRGRMKVTIVALARRLAGILYAMRRDGTTFQPRHPEKGTTE